MLELSTAVRPRLLFLDIDGTLVGADGHLPDRTRLAIHNVRESGILPILCTGRSRQNCNRIMERIGQSEFLIVLNGAITIDCLKNETVRTALINVDDAKGMASKAYQVGMAPLWLEATLDDEFICVDRKVMVWEPYLKVNQHRMRFVDSLATTDLNPPASIVCYGFEEQCRQLVDTWQRIYGESVYAIAGYTGFYAGWYAQLTTSSATKQSAAMWLAEQLGVAASECVAIGDHHNDIGLLQWAGVGVAMGSGHPDAIAVADAVTSTLAEEGAAQVMEWLVRG